MKQRFFFTTLVLLVASVLSACGGALQPAAEPAGDQAALKVRAVEVAFTGVVEAMNGNEWTVNGQTLLVDPAVVRDGPFQAGDTIKVEGTVNTDGSLSVSRVEAPSAADLTTLPQLGNDNTNANSNDANSNDANANNNDSNSNDANANGNDNNTNDDSANANSNDDDSNDANANGNDDQGNSNSNTNDDDDDSSGGNSNGGGSDDSGDDDSGGGGNSNDDDD